MNGLHALVLAAGLGSRFGGAKLTRPWGEGLLIDGALSAAQGAPVAGVWVTVGADPVVADAARRRIPPGRLHLVPVPDFADGLSASLRAGIAALPDDAAGVLIFLGDMPRIPSAVLAPMAAALSGGALAAAPFHGGERGHPVAVSRSLFPQLAGLSGDKGAGRLLAGLGDRLVRIDSPDDGVLFDVDRSDEAL